MKFWIRKWVMRALNLVAREDHMRVWDLWSEAVSADLRTMSQIQYSLEVLTRTNEHLIRENTELAKSNRQMMLELSIVNVAPLETMDRALDTLRGIPEEFRSKSSNVGRAILEMEHGIDLIRKMPSVKGASNGK